MSNGNINAHRGRTIQMYLVNNDIDGMVVATIHGWTGQVTKVPRHMLGSFEDRDGADQTAVYILIGGTDGNSAYIGETENANVRLKSHVTDPAKRIVFDHAYVINAFDGNLTKAHVRCLEYELYVRARAAGRFTITNISTPPSSKLPEAQLAFMNEFLANAELLLSALGARLLEPLINIPKAMPAPPQDPIITADYDRDEGVYRIPYRPQDPALKGEYIKGILLPDGRMLVLKGTPMSADADLGKWQNRIRQNMIDEGLVVKDPGGGQFYVQTSHIVYNRPTSAAALLTGKIGYKEKGWTHISRSNMKIQMDSGQPDTRDIDVSNFPTIEIPRKACASVE